MAPEKVLVIALLLCLAANAIAQTPEQLLRNAILDVNIQNFELTKNIVLTQDLPVIPDGRILSIKGKLNGGGQAVKIDGGGKFRMFRGTGKINLSLENLILTRVKKATAVETPAAVAIVGERSSASLTSVTFSSNPRAVDIDRALANIQSCTFTGHTKSAIAMTDISPGTGCCQGDATVIGSSTFTGNAGNEGGAIFSDTARVIQISQCLFSKNTATTGGALRFLQNAKNNIQDCTFTANTAAKDGGAVSFFDAYTYLGNVTFKANVAKNGAGGALHLASDGSDGNNIVDKTTFDSNKASASFGGAFVMDSNVKLTICSPTFVNNIGKGKKTSNGFITSSGAKINGYPISFVDLAPGVGPPEYTTGVTCDLF